MLKKALDTFFEQEAIPHYEKWEKEKRIPRAFWKKLGDQGFLCMDVPEAYGGGIPCY